MSNKVIIASDSTTDLTPELIEEYGIKILPLGVTLGEKLYTDGVDIHPDDIYAHYERTGELPKTSAINTAECYVFFKNLCAGGCGVVFFTISSELSSTYSNAKLAAEHFENVFVVDTRSLSTGGGLLAAAAGDMAKAGMEAREIAEACKDLADKVCASFVVDDLTFLHKGGRCSALTAIGANLVQIKPCIAVSGGKMSVVKKYRGRFGAVLKKYVADIAEETQNIDFRRVFVTHAGCDEETVDQCVRQVKEALPFEEVTVSRAGCTISSHCGRNTLGVLFMTK